MNFLAHLYLSGDDPDIRIGNFIADAVKGHDMDLFRDGIRRGIVIHRAIDTYTDAHPVFRESSGRLHEKYHKYSGVIVDMLYDHFLAVDWDKWHTTGLREFAASAYSLLLRNYTNLPSRTKRGMPFLVMMNWLVSYADLNALGRFYSGMARRTSFQSNMEHAVDDIRKDYDLYKQEFDLFFPEIISYISEEFQVVMSERRR